MGTTGLPVDLHFVYARHGRELMGCPFDPTQGKGSPLYVNPVNVLNTLAKVPADGKGIFVRSCLKEARAQSYEPTNRNGIQGPVSG
jgi:hypothetical protein